MSPGREVGRAAASGGGGSGGGGAVSTQLLSLRPAHPYPGAPPYLKAADFGLVLAHAAAGLGDQAALASVELQTSQSNVHRTDTGNEVLLRLPGPWW